MTPGLLPTDFDAEVTNAVRIFWANRVVGISDKSQGGSRDAVVSGKNMNGFIELVSRVVVHCGFAEETVQRKPQHLTLPGFFRATKNWDVLVVHQHRLLGVFEFKSQVGSFGNNFNNRSEEVIGSAADLWVAHHLGAYGNRALERPNEINEPVAPLLNPAYQADPRPPFVGWLMLLEECAASLAPVRCAEPHFTVFPEFHDASYARRYQILCERLVERRLYSAAALELTPTATAVHRSLSPATSIRNLFAEFAGRLLAMRES